MLAAGFGWEHLNATLAQQGDFLSGLICVLRIGGKRENFDLDTRFLAQEFQKICDLFAAVKSGMTLLLPKSRKTPVKSRTILTLL